MMICHHEDLVKEVTMISPLKGHLEGIEHRICPRHEGGMEMKEICLRNDGRNLDSLMRLQFETIVEKEVLQISVLLVFERTWTCRLSEKVVTDHLMCHIEQETVQTFHLRDETGDEPRVYHLDVRELT